MQIRREEEEVKKEGMQRSQKGKREEIRGPHCRGEKIATAELEEAKSKVSPDFHATEDPLRAPMRVILSLATAQSARRLNSEKWTLEMMIRRSSGIKNIKESKSMCLIMIRIDISLLKFNFEMYLESSTPHIKSFLFIQMDWRCSSLEC